MDTPTKRCTRCGNSYEWNTKHFRSENGKIRQPCRNCLREYEQKRRPPKHRIKMSDEERIRKHRESCRRYLDKPKQTPNILRQCVRCGRVLPADNFHATTGSKDGLSPACKQCISVYTKQYYGNHKEEDAARSKHYRETHLEQIKEDSRKYYKENAPEIRRKTKEWAKNNPVRARRNAYVSVIRRRARKRNLPDTFTVEEADRMLEYFNHRCAICNAPAGLWHTLAMDHWIPLSSPNCPGTVATNMVPMCHAKKDGEGGCNNRKLNKQPVEWLIQEFGKRKAREITTRIEQYFKWIAEQD